MLADCYECGKVISSEASRCVHCGYYYDDTTSVEQKAGGGYVRHYAGYRESSPPRPLDAGEYFWSVLGSLFLGAVWAVAPLIGIPCLAFISSGFRNSMVWASYPSESLSIITGMLGFAYGLYLYVYKLLLKP
jgi:hypothetical protein